jgi:hypothetical protein
MVLFFSLVSACAFVRSKRWLTATARSASRWLRRIHVQGSRCRCVLVLALAWWKQPPERGLVRSTAGALHHASPWLALAVAYFALRLWIFGDPFRVFPGSSPLRTLVSGEWMTNLLSLRMWWPQVMPEAFPRRVKRRTAAAALLALIAAARERAGPHAARVRQLERARRECCCYTRLAPVGRRAAPMNRPGRGWSPAAGAPKHDGVAAADASRASPDARASGDERRAEAGATWTRVGSIAAIADAVPSGGYAFVVLPDYIGAIPFGRDSQAGLMLPPLQKRSLAPRLVVQTSIELDRWPDLFQRDIIGRLQREPLGDVAANPLTPKVPPPHLYPDRYYCFNPRSRALVPLARQFAPDLADWTQQWQQALTRAGCGGAYPMSMAPDRTSATN